MADNPEFLLPFKLTSTGALEIEQGEPEEIQQCVYVSLCFQPGDLLVQPDMGLPDQLFHKGGVDLDAIQAAITEDEPRASEVIDRDPAWLTTLVETITIRRDPTGG